MSFVEPIYTKNQVNKAGSILIREDGELFSEDWFWAQDVLANRRACHGYPMNTFQATLRSKLRSVDRGAIVAQRLKRAPSIVAKLRRFASMNLSQMQDIGGLRAVVGSVSKVRRLEKAYRNANFTHDLVSSKDYIKDPKQDGYRSVHLIYRYRNPLAPEYDGILLELQFRTRLQHAFATAVETMGTFLGQALKSGQGETEWRKFFEVAGAALAIVEKTPPVPGFDGKSDEDVFGQLERLERKLRVLEKLRGFAVATGMIKAERGQGAYHLIVLNSKERTVSITPFPIARLEEANREYATIEKRTSDGEPVEAVLVSAGPVGDLRKAYPNYFLDTEEFVRRIEKLIKRDSPKGNPISYKSVSAKKKK